MTKTNTKQKFNSFQDFYPYYLSEHSNATCRKLHFIGNIFVIIFIFVSIIKLKFIILSPIFGYGFAWAGHFFFEKNKPATFTHPLYSLIGDWVMFKDIILKKISI